MKFTLNLGNLQSAKPSRPASSGKDVLRLAVLGDFSGRASSGQLATGSDLASRKAIAVDVDNLDDVVRRLAIKLTLPIGEGGGAVEIPILSMDDFHPDQLYDNVEVFSGLSGLRQRLKTTSTFAKAAQEVQSWLGSTPADTPSAKPAESRASAIPSGGNLSDFARLMGQPATEQADTPIDQLLKQIIGPHIVPAKDPKQDKLIAAVDQAVGETMRGILHHPDFQALESAWRGVEFLVRRLETGANLRIFLYDISAEEFAADLSTADNLDQTGLYSLLIEQPAADAQRGPLSAIATNYFFEQTPAHADLLGRMGRIAAAGQMAFLAGIGVDALKKLKPEEIDPAVAESWAALRALQESGYLGLTVPRFMLRNPYGEKTDPIDRFDFEEFTPGEGLRGVLYSSGAILAGLLLGETFLKGGLKKMNLGSIMTAGDMPYFFFEDADGDQVALPCTERLLSVDVAAHVTSQGFLPVLAIKGKPEVRLGSFQSLTSKPLAGPWAPIVLTPAAAPPPSSAPEPAVPAPAVTPPADFQPPAPQPPSRPAEPNPPQPAADAPPADSAAAPSSADNELDALLASLNPPQADPPAADPAAAVPSSVDNELDALLASLNTPSTDAAPANTEAEPELDPALAALLADL